MSDESKREEVVRAYEDLKATLSVLASMFGSASLSLHGKMAVLATQASSELYQAVAHIKRSHLKSAEDVSFIKEFVSRTLHGQVYCDNLWTAPLVFDGLYNGVKKEGHKELAGHIKGVSTYLIKLYKLSVKLNIQ